MKINLISVDWFYDKNKTCVFLVTPACSMFTLNTSNLKIIQALQVSFVCKAILNEYSLLFGIVEKTLASCQTVPVDFSCS